MSKRDVIERQRILQIEESLNELYLMFSLNVVNFVEDLDKNWDEQIKEYAKLICKYVIKLNQEFEEAYYIEDQEKIRNEIVKRLKTLYEIISNAEKLDQEEEYYTRIVWDLDRVIRNYTKLSIG